MNLEKIALFDMDGTLCDYDEGLFKELEKLRSTEEPIIEPPYYNKNLPKHIISRMNLIRSSESWWANLPRFDLGWDILKIAKELEYRTMILTQGSKHNPNSWSGKKRWIDENLGPDQDITITRDKGLVYGSILVDDFPEYVERWLTWRKNGLVIMPANNANKNYKHKQVIIYDGTNIELVVEAMKKERFREK